MPCRSNGCHVVLAIPAAYCTSSEASSRCLKTVQDLVLPGCPLPAEWRLQPSPCGPRLCQTWRYRVATVLATEIEDTILATVLATEMEGTILVTEMEGTILTTEIEGIILATVLVMKETTRLARNKTTELAQDGWY